MQDNRTILQGDVLERLKDISDETIDCIITSPPYWGLRDYGVDGQLGLESDFRQYLEKMGVIMDELKRVLKGTGTCWVNIGDTYNSSGPSSTVGGFQGEQRMKNKDYDDAIILDKRRGKSQSNGPVKSRIGIPERFYINCIDSGWIARNHIPWYKSNSMPSSVKDRFSNKWESIFFFAKKQKYYFDLNAVREKTVTETKPFNVRVRDANKERFLQKALDSEKAVHNSKGEKFQPYSKDIKSVSPGSGGHTGLDNYHRYEKKQDSTLGANGKPNPTYKGFNERWKDRKSNNIPGQDPHGKLKSHSGYYDEDGNCLNNPNGKNPGDVFFINPKPFPESHFATFPVELPERILKCACPERGIVLDPFFGAGTVGVAAEKLNHQWIGIELNEEYIKIARKRLEPYQNNKLDSFDNDQ